MIRIAIALAVLGAAAPAVAKVHEISDQGFVVRHGADVDASPRQAWSVLTQPSRWWNGTHTFSGDAANLSLDARAGGCFCEILPNPESPRASPNGSVEHMHVVYAQTDRALRMTGTLGPLQAEAANGTLTIFLKPIEDGGTRFLLEYVVGGYMRPSPEKFAQVSDSVLGEQLTRLARELGARGMIEPREGGNRLEAEPADEAEAETPVEEAAEASVSETDAQGTAVEAADDESFDDAFSEEPIIGR